MLAVRVTYRCWSDLAQDVEFQLARGGLLARVSPETELPPGHPVALEVLLPDGRRLAARGEVLQGLGASGVAVGLDPSFVASVRAAADAASGAAATGIAAEHELVFAHPGDGAASAGPSTQEAQRLLRAQAAPRADGEGGGATRVPGAEKPPERRRLDGLSTAEKIQVALHGTRDERAAVLRDPNRAVHPYVLRNPQVTPEEVTEMARNAQASPELLSQIAERRDWLQRPAVALALARNPKTPPDVGVRALEFVPQDALRQMAKGTGVLPHVVQAARRRVLSS